MTQQVGVVDFGAGNLASVRAALRRAGEATGQQPAIHLVDNPDALTAMDRIVLPGVGAFGACRAALADQGLWQALRDHVEVRARPFLGICVGMQLMADAGEERGRHEGFGWISGTVRRLDHHSPPPRLPHMGWNHLELTDEGVHHPVLEGLGGEAFYYVHSYAFDAASHVLAESTYHVRFAAVVGVDTRLGVQFHPEKSQQPGLRLLSRFLEWKP